MDFENSTYDANLEYFLIKIDSINTAGQNLKHENHSMLPHLTVHAISAAMSLFFMFKKSYQNYKNLTIFF